VGLRDGKKGEKTNVGKIKERKGLHCPQERKRWPCYQPLREGLPPIDSKKGGMGEKYKENSIAKRSQSLLNRKKKEKQVVSEKGG